LGGAYANATSTPLQISPDGRLVLFSSVADNLAPGDTNRLEDVFLADLEAGTVVLVSAKDGQDASSSSRGSSQALMSADGQRVFFLSTARDLVSGPSAGSTGNNLLLREPAQKRTRLLSRDTPGGLTGIQGRVIQFGLTDDGARAYFSAGFSAAAIRVDGDSAAPVHTEENSRPLPLEQFGNPFGPPLSCVSPWLRTCTPSSPVSALRTTPDSARPARRIP
jgi:hypothetical protein